MSVSTYSYLIGETVTLLNEDEWETIEPFAMNRLGRIKKYREAHGCGLKEALEKEDVGQEALDKYEQSTGVRLSHPDQIWQVSDGFVRLALSRVRTPFQITKGQAMCQLWPSAPRR